MSLEELRNEINALDLQILGLIKNRLEIAKKIGVYKKEHKYPVRNVKIEEKVIERAKDYALNLGIPTELATQVIRLLIEFSVKIQLQNWSNSLND
ncbi:MAG: chorismate mutase [Promethearchaeota archaeon]